MYMYMYFFVRALARREKSINLIIEDVKFFKSSRLDLTFLVFKNFPIMDRIIICLGAVSLFQSLQVISYFLGQFCPRGKSAMRLSLCEAPSRETRQHWELCALLSLLLSVTFIRWGIFQISVQVGR